MLRYCQYIYLLLLFLLHSCAGSGRLTEIPDQEFKGSYYTIDTPILKNKEMDLMLLAYKTGLDSQMNKVLGQSELPLTKAQPDCTLGYLVADALFESGKEKDPMVIAAVSNQGGIRISYLAPGAVTLGNVYEIMPFENMLVVLEVPGEVMYRWMQHIAGRGGWPVSHIRFEIEGDTAKNIYVNGQPIHPNIVYRVATSDYIANGGDDCSFLKDCKRYRYNILMRDAITAYIEKRSRQGLPIHFEPENRIRYAE